MNKFITIGRLTKDPEIRTTKSDKSVCSFSIAVKRRFVNNDVDVDFFNVTVWGKQADNCGKYLTKGSQVAISGRVENQKWNDNDGNPRISTEIVAEEVQFLTPKSENTTSSKPSENTSKIKEKVDDLPF